MVDGTQFFSEMNSMFKTFMKATKLCLDRFYIEKKMMIWSQSYVQLNSRLGAKLHTRVF
jgi:hypothetical protein